MQAAASDELAQLLLSSIALDAAALHVGRYCAPASDDPERPSPLIARLVELLFFYLNRHAAQPR